MHKKGRTIGQRMAKTRKTAIHKEIVKDWLIDWQSEQTALVESLLRAVELSSFANAQDFHEFRSAVNQLSAVTEKKFMGLETIHRNLFPLIEDQELDYHFDVVKSTREEIKK